MQDILFPTHNYSENDDHLVLQLHLNLYCTYYIKNSSTVYIEPHFYPIVSILSRKSPSPLLIPTLFLSYQL